MALTHLADDVAQSTPAFSKMETPTPVIPESVDAFEYVNSITTPDFVDIAAQIFVVGTGARWSSRAAGSFDNKQPSLP